jgi:hypothetical protein
MGKKNGVDISTYQPAYEMTMTRRAAHFLDWAAKNQPRSFVPYNLALKAILGTATTPPANSVAVEHFRKSLGRSKDILLKTYGREMIRARDAGVRASVDSGDALTGAVFKKEKHVQTAVISFVEAMEHLNPSEFPKGADFKEYREHYENSMKSTVKVFSSNSFLEKLTPPKMVPMLPPAKK